MPRLRPLLAACLAALVIPLDPVASAQVVPPGLPDLPVLGAQVARGGGLIATPAAPIPPVPKVIDGSIEDWIGRPTHLAGTAIYSAGEYVYSDHLMDDWGPDDGSDAERDAVTDPLSTTEPRLYRVEAAAQFVGDQTGAPGFAQTNYGDGVYPPGLTDHADITEVRVAADEERLTFLVRTQQMTATPGTAVLVLIDTEEEGTYPAPGGLTTAAEHAFLAIGDAVVAATYKGEPIADCSACAGLVAATEPDGFVNAMEIAVPLAALGGPPGPIRVAVAAGVSNAEGTGLADLGAGPDLMNVAFRFHEPARVWMDHDQALALLAGSIDPFLTTVDPARLRSGETEAFEPRPGYWERIYESDSPVNQERESKDYFQGPFQHYGLYLPSSYRPDVPAPTTFWLHYNGGRAHDAAAWEPGVLRDLGEERGAIVISPGARGTTSGYTGRGYEDFLEVFDDATTSFAVDPDRVTLGGYSLGGFGAYLYGLLRPDLFAGVFPVVGPAAAREPTFTPITPLDQPMTLQSIFENARDLPFVIYHGTNDEIIPYSDIVQQAARFIALGYRHRLYSFTGYEHYTFAVIDEWTEAARYLDGLRRDPNPPHVTYRVWPALETLMETDNAPVPLSYSFDGAYWVDDLTTRDGDPADPATMGTFDGISFGRGMAETIAIPEAGTGGQTTAYAMAGVRWLQTGPTTTANGLSVTATNLAAARIDLERMGISTRAPIGATITTDGLFELVVVGQWAREPVVTGAAVTGFDGTELRLTFLGGSSVVSIAP